MNPIRRVIASFILLSGLACWATAGEDAVTYAEVFIRGDLGSDTDTDQVIQALDDAESRRAAFVIIIMDSATGREADARAIAAAIGRLEHATAIAWVKTARSEALRIRAACDRIVQYGEFHDPNVQTDSPFIYCAARNYGQLRQILGVERWEKLASATRQPRSIMLNVVADPAIAARELRWEEEQRQKAAAEEEARRELARRLEEHEKQYGHEIRDLEAQVASLQARIVANNRTIREAEIEIAGTIRSLDMELILARTRGVHNAAETYNQARLAAIGAHEALLKSLRNDSERAVAELQVAVYRLSALRTPAVTSSR